MDPSEKLMFLAGETFEYSNQYIQKNIKLLKLELAEKMAKVISNLVVYFVMSLLLSFVILMLTLGMVVLLADLWGSYTIAFLAAAAIHTILIILIAYVFKNYLITNPILKMVLNAFLD